MRVSLFGAGSLLLALAVTSGTPGDDTVTPAIPATNAELKAELLYRRELDQNIRRNLIEAVNAGGTTGRDAFAAPAVKPLVEQMKQIDKENVTWLQAVIDARGWPLRTQVGAHGSQAAFLIAQHASSDLAFQKRCLKLMETAPPNEVAPSDIALLTDRVRLAEGKKQLYGTQVEQLNGAWAALPTEDPANLDDRRAKMGLPPMAEYLKLVAQAYQSGGGTFPDSGKDAEP